MEQSSDVDSAALRTGLVPVLGQGIIPGICDDGFDVFLPSFGQGPNTGFLPEFLLDEKAPGYVKTNEFLQAEADASIFVLGANSGREGFVAPVLREQAKTISKNILAMVQGRKRHYNPHKPFKGSLNVGSNPMTIKIGNGNGSYMIWNNLPQPDKTLINSCGFPCCPCTCAAAGCNPAGCFLCGFCCAAPEGERVAKAYELILGTAGVKAFPAMIGNTKYATFGSKSLKASPPLDAPGQNVMPKSIP
ncbi:unnamed protein product [Amoebophrya sp. A25]|nr:unnamed protein product [Amoebophrya sp. A25]|eukprot:GSA25T00014013001.1